MSRGRLLLVSWHIGDELDTTFRAAAAVARLRTLLVEDLEDARRQLRRAGGPEGDKTLLQIPEEPEPAFFERVLAALAGGDVGLLSSGGTPGFVDPGAWLVGEARRRGVEIRALPGASCLTTMLALSAVEWRRLGSCAFSFSFYLAASGGREEAAFREWARRREPLFVFVNVADVARCVESLRPAVGERLVTIFFDLTKPRGEFPFGDAVRAATCAEWAALLPGLPWDRISEVSIMVAA